MGCLTESDLCFQSLTSRGNFYPAEAAQALVKIDPLINDTSLRKTIYVLRSLQLRALFQKGRQPVRRTVVRLRVRTNNRMEVPIGQKYWSVRSGRQLRRREAGGEQTEANDQSIDKTMMNSIWPDALASCTVWRSQRKPSVEGAPNFSRPISGETVSSKIGMDGVVGDRMVGSRSDMNQGSRTGKGAAFMVCGRPEELYPGGDRASVVAKKRGNALMPVEPMEAGRWKRERQPGGTITLGSAGNGSTRGRNLRSPVGMGEPAVWSPRPNASFS